MAETIEALVEGGKATPGPPLGPALGPMGVNIGEIIQAINKKTKDFAGMKVPVKVTVDPKTKAFEIEIGTPPVSALVLKELGIEKGAGNPLEENVGDMSLDQLLKVTRMKSDGLLGATMAARSKEVLGACRSMGVTVDGKKPAEMIAAINSGEVEIPDSD